MANGHGGDRVPRKPAGASGPGALSGRTDGQAQRIASGGGYGERKNMEQIQSGAPMAERSIEASATPPPQPQPVPLNAPSMRPEEPVTAGAAMGAGIGPEAAGILDDRQATLEQLAPMVEGMVQMANMPSATPQFRSFVRKLRVMTNRQQR